MNEDTEPSCRAMIIMRELAGDKTFNFMRRLQNAFFADNKDISKEGVLAELAAEEGEDRDNFLSLLTSVDAKAASKQEFSATRAMGIDGYPTTIMRNGEDYKLASAGYRPTDGVRKYFDDNNILSWTGVDCDVCKHFRLQEQITIVEFEPRFDRARLALRIRVDIG